MAEFEPITDRALDELVGEVDRELEMLQQLSNGGEPLSFNDIRWIKSLAKQMPEVLQTTESEVRTEAPRLFRVALESFRQGLLVGSGRVDLEDWFRTRLIDHYLNQGGQNG